MSEHRRNGRQFSRSNGAERIDPGVLTAEKQRSYNPLRTRMGRIAVAGTFLAASTLVGLETQDEAHANEPPASVAHHVYRTDGDGVWLHEEPGIHAPLEVVMPEGAEFDVECFDASSDVVNGNAVWLEGTYNGQHGAVTDYYIDTHWKTTEDLKNQGIQECGQETESNSHSYNEVPGFSRQAAATWALQHARDVQPYQDECTWFVSHALWAGGLEKTSEWTDQGGHGPLNRTPGSETAWFVGKLTDYILRTYPDSDVIPLDFHKNSVPQAEPGDLIEYDWNGKDGYDHFSVVTDIAPGQYPEVAEWGNVDPGKASQFDKRGWTWSKHYNGWIESVYSKPSAKLIHIEMPNTY